MSDLILKFVRNWGINVVSDGDIDGVFAAGLLLSGIRSSGVSVDNARIFFPRAKERQNLEVNQSIMVELRPERGLIYRGKNLLIDHHPEPPIIAIYHDSEPVLIRKYNMSCSVAGLVHYVFEEVLNVPTELIDAVDAADYKSFGVPLTRELTRAFLISRNVPAQDLSNFFQQTRSICDNSGRLYEIICGEIRNNSIYGYLIAAILQELWNEIFDWIRQEDKRYRKEILPVAKKLYNKAYGNKDIRWVVYNYGNKKERTAIDDVMYDLQRESKIVFIVGVTRSGFLVRIATREGEVDLLGVCKKISNLNLDCGGRSDVIGIYFPRTKFTLDDVIGNILSALMGRA